ncbi:aminoglycoside adenylyltransferase domain-containing protein [Streptomyces sp. NPDC001795]|uniref:nucleotidyltransferase domain-containing protein n=1 Tax=unclassified Streptomyces TaxID=2593676 RepID=UPI00331D9D1D
MVEAYLKLTDQAVPGLIEGLYLHGSLTYGDFRPGRSDVDFLAVVSERPAERTVEALRRVFEELSGCYPRPYFDGLHVTRADLVGPPKDCPDVPCVGEWNFQSAGRHGLNPVTWHELAQQAITLRGPKLTANDIWTDRMALHAYSHANLGEYWRPSLEKLRAGQERVLAAPIERAEWLTEWFVLGVARLHHLLTTDRLSSKGGAGQYALTAFDKRWHPIVNEALRIREGSTAISPAYDGEPAARVRDTIAFAAMAIEEGQKLARQVHVL